MRSKCLGIFLLIAMLALLNGCSLGGKSDGSNAKGEQAVGGLTGQTSSLIGDVVIDAYGPTWVRLSRQNDSGSAADTLQAYIGLNGSITVNSNYQVQNALSAPLNITSGNGTFTGLASNRSYRIYLIAQNGGTPVAASYINLIRPEYAEINPADYLEMSEEEFGQLKWALKVADDELDDFSRIESLDALGIPGTSQYVFGAYRYAIAFATYFLAMEQYQKIPACQDIIKNRMDRLIQKMINKKVWKYWAATSPAYFTFLFSNNLGKNFDLFYPVEHDPIASKKNVMYSGHLAQMISLYEKLYGDLKWSQPGSIVFEWNENEKYVYDNNSLHLLLRDAFINLPDHCIECEPNMCYPECNQHAILALKVYDQVHGTSLYAECEPIHYNWYIKNNIINPKTHDTASAYFPLTDKTMGPTTANWDTGNILSLVSVPVSYMLRFYFAFAAADAWTGAFMHAWQPEYIEQHYPYQKEHRINSKTGELKPDIVADQLAVGLFAIYAAELGDYATRDNLLAQCDDLYSPEWTEDGAYTYPLGSMDTTVNLFYYHNHFANAVTGSLAGLARATPKDGLLTLHSDPFSGVSGPIVKDVDVAKAKLLRAVYDNKRDVLVVTVDAGALAQSGDTCTIKVERLDPARKWHLKIDATEVQTITGASMALIEVPLDGRHDIILAAE